jgi:type VI protein secretion system component VasF
MQAHHWLRAAIAEALSLIMLLERGVGSGGFDPHTSAPRIEAAIVKIKLDDRARALEFNADMLQRVRLALIVTADEITQRHGSRADYSAPPPPGEQPLLQQKFFGGIIRGGHSFFEELDTALASRRPGDAELAVIEVFALCIALGFRGTYNARDLVGYEAMRSRVNDKLRLEPIVGPPLAAAVPWPHPAPLRRWPLWIGLSALIFSGAMLLTYRLEFGRHASGLRDFLQQILDRTLT